jgi:hypothetical protein
MVDLADRDSIQYNGNQTHTLIVMPSVTVLAVLFGTESDTPTLRYCIFAIRCPRSNLYVYLFHIPTRRPTPLFMLYRLRLTEGVCVSALAMFATRFFHTDSVWILSLRKDLIYVILIVGHLMIEGEMN